jgi:hypothetical protein
VEHGRLPGVSGGILAPATVTTLTPHTGQYCAYVFDGAYLTQTFSPAVTGDRVYFYINATSLGNSGSTNVIVTYSDGYTETVSAPDKSKWQGFYIPLASQESVHGGVSGITFEPVLGTHGEGTLNGALIDDVSLLATGAESITTATGSGTASFNSDAGTITNLQAVDESSLPTTGGKPSGVTFPDGFFSFTITGLTPGQTVTVTIHLPTTVSPGSQYWKCQNGLWFSVPTTIVDSHTISITLTDGGTGDADGTANGVIVDPGGLAILVVVGVIPEVPLGTILAALSMTIALGTYVTIPRRRSKRLNTIP